VGQKGPLPLIVFSHGFGGNMDAFPLTSSAWAAAGYATAHPTHADSVRPSPDRTALGARMASVMRQLAAGDLAGEQRAEFVRMLDDPSHLDGRASDVAAILEACRKKQIPEPLNGRIDTDRLGMAGHSYGAYTTLALGGAQVTRKDGRRSFAEPQFSAFLVISGQGPGRMGLDQASFSTMRKPTMWVTGSRDFGAAGETPSWRLEPFELSPPGAKYSLFVEGARHSDFDAPPGAKELGALLRARETAFWDAYVRGSSEARRSLSIAPGDGLSARART
jgi:predicted dienelactone hydrolase